MELHEWSRGAGGAQALITFTSRDWRDLQLLSQLAWMDEEWLAKDPVVCRLANRGKDFSEKDKEALKGKIIELIGLVLPGASGSRAARPDRDEHYAVLSSDLAAALRFRHCRAWRIPARRCHAGLFGVPKTPGNNCGGRRNITKRYSG